MITCQLPAHQTFGGLFKCCLVLAEHPLMSHLHTLSRLCAVSRSTENGVLQVGASQYMAALIIGFVNSATIQVSFSSMSFPPHWAVHRATINEHSLKSASGC